MTLRISLVLILVYLVAAPGGAVDANPQKNPPKPSPTGDKKGPPPRVAHGPDAALLQPYEDRITALETAIRDRQDQIKLIRQTAKGPEEKSRVAPLEQEIRTLRDEIKSVRDEMHDAREASKTKPAAPKEPKPKVKGPDKKK